MQSMIGISYPNPSQSQY